jgi:hypothetical protein
MTKFLYPNLYTTYDGGILHKWLFGPINKEFFSKNFYGRKFIEFPLPENNSVTIHSIIFTDNTRWDITNGFNKEPIMTKISPESRPEINHSGSTLDRSKFKTTTFCKCPICKFTNDLGWENIQEHMTKFKPEPLCTKFDNRSTYPGKVEYVGEESSNLVEADFDELQLETEKLRNCGTEDNKMIFEKKSYLGKCLDEAKLCITGERQDSYGSPEDSFTIISEYWSVYLKHKNNNWTDAQRLDAKDVSHMMMLFKIARCSGQKHSRDNYIDIAGYASIAADRLSDTKE